MGAKDKWSPNVAPTDSVLSVVDEQPHYNEQPRYHDADGRPIAKTGNSGQNPQDVVAYVSFYGDQYKVLKLNERAAQFNKRNMTPSHQKALDVWVSQMIDDSTDAVYSFAWYRNADDRSITIKASAVCTTDVAVLMIIR